jgi:hypothetical protein
MAGGFGMRCGAAPRPIQKAKRRFALGIGGLRARIESVFASLEDQFQIEETRARSVWGVMTRVVAKLLAYMVSFVANEALGYPGTALKSLYR